MKNSPSLKKNDRNEPQELLDYFINENIDLTVFLVNGIKLQGKITSRTDPNSYTQGSPVMYVLERDNHSQVIMAHAISTIMPS